MPEATVRPRRPELLALLDAVKDHPDEDTPRLVLADWLDEQSDRFDAGRARYIRRHIAEARGLERPPVSNQARQAESEVLRRWLEPFSNFKSGWSFERGLPGLTIEGPRLLKPDVPALLATEAFAFVQFVHLTEAGGPRTEALAAMPEFRHVPGVSLHPFSAFGADSAARFFASPNVAGLRRIDFRSVKPGVVGIQALAANPALGRLRKLLLAHNKLVDKAVAALAASKHLTNLQVLDLSDNLIGDAGAEALAASATLANLLEINLRENPRLTDAGKRALRDTFGDRAKLD